MSLPTVKFDKWFSLWVRLKDTDWKGWGECYTCGKRSYWLYLECGHFMSRQNMSTRFEEQGCRPQCDHCNCALKGNLKKFKRKLISEIGLEEVLRIEKLAKQTKKWGRSEMEEQIWYYKTEVQRMGRDKGIKI